MSFVFLWLGVQSFFVFLIRVDKECILVLTQFVVKSRVVFCFLGLRGAGDGFLKLTNMLIEAIKKVGKGLGLYPPFQI